MNKTLTTGKMPTLAFSAKLAGTLQQNCNAFKKNKADNNKQNVGSIMMNYPMSMLSDAQTHSTQSKEQKHVEKVVFQHNLSVLHKMKSKHIESYQMAIKSLKDIVKSLMQKNTFLNYDRAQLLKENFSIKKSNQLLKEQLQNLRKQFGNMLLKGGIGGMSKGLYAHTNKIFQECYSQTEDQQVDYETDNLQHFERNFQNCDGSQTPCTPYYTGNTIMNENQINDGKLISINDSYWINDSQKKGSNQQEQEGNSRSRQVLISNINSLDESLDCTQICELGSAQQQQSQQVQGFLQQRLPQSKLHYVEMPQCADKILSVSKPIQSPSINGSLIPAPTVKYLESQLYLPLDQIECRNMTPSNSEGKGYCVSSSLRDQGFKKQYDSSGLRVDGNFVNCEQVCQQGYPKQSCSRQQTEATMTVRCLATGNQGPFRAFYLSILQFPEMRKRLIEAICLLQDEDNEDLTLFELYPNNRFCGDILIGFIRAVSNQHLSGSAVVDHINQHKLIDILMVQCLKSMVGFLFVEAQEVHLSPGHQMRRDSPAQTSRIFDLENSTSVPNILDPSCQGPTCVEILHALSQKFDLRISQHQNAISFYPDQPSSDASNIISLSSSGSRKLYTRNQQGELSQRFPANQQLENNHYEQQIMYDIEQKRSLFDIFQFDQQKTQSKDVNNNILQSVGSENYTQTKMISQSPNQLLEITTQFMFQLNFIADQMSRDRSPVFAHQGHQNYQSNSGLTGKSLNCQEQYQYYNSNMYRNGSNHQQECIQQQSNLLASSQKKFNNISLDNIHSMRSIMKETDSLNKARPNVINTNSHENQNNFSVKKYGHDEPQCRDNTQYVFKQQSQYSPLRQQNFYGKCQKKFNSLNISSQTQQKNTANCKFLRS